jgi:hypothetical protein
MIRWCSCLGLGFGSGSGSPGTGRACYGRRDGWPSRGRERVGQRGRRREEEEEGEDRGEGRDEVHEGNLHDVRIQGHHDHGHGLVHPMKDGLRTGSLRERPRRDQGRSECHRTRGSHCQQLAVAPRLPAGAADYESESRELLHRRTKDPRRSRRPREVEEGLVGHILEDHGVGHEESEGQGRRHQARQRGIQT